VRLHTYALHFSIFCLFLLSTAAIADLPTTIEQVKPSIVAIGTYKKTQSPPFIFRGTGFALGDGNQIATNAHVLPDLTQIDAPELAILIRGSGGEGSIRHGRILSKDSAHDLAIIRIDGPPLPPLKLGESSAVREGQSVAFTGFPIGGALGFSPVTHRGIVSAITPIVIPGGNSSQLNMAQIRQIKRGSFDVLQLDATAYPGNSGSPLFDANNGTVIGIINMVFIKGSKEAALSNPSGITYAIPVEHLKNLIRNN
jgi:serine protease Do